MGGSMLDSTEQLGISGFLEGMTGGILTGQQYREMFDSLPAAVYTTDAAGRVTYFNPACVEFSGRTPRVGLDNWCVTWKLYYPDGRPMGHEECPMAVALKEQRAVRGGEAIAERPDGTRVWFEPFPTPLFDRSGKLVGAINMLVDITASRKEVRHLERLHELSLRLAEGDCQPAAVMRIVLEAAKELVGSDKCTAQLYNPETGNLELAAEIGFDAEAWEKFKYISREGISTCAKAMRTGKKIVVDDIVTSPDFCEFSQIAASYEMRGGMSVPLVDSGGELLGMFSTYWSKPHRASEQDLRYLDIYIQQAARHVERKRGERALKQSEERFRAVFEQSATGIAELDVTGRFTLVNETFCRIVGRSREALLGGMGRRDILHPDYWAANDEKFKALVEGRCGDFVVEARYVRPGGEIVWVRNSVSGIRDGEGRMKHVLATVTDVTKEKALIEDLARAKERAESASLAKDRFLAVLSHELRTPLSPVVMSVAAMELNPELPAMIREDLSMIRRNVELEARLIDDLLDLSRVSSGKLRLQKEMLLWNEALRQACQTCRPFVFEKGIELHCELDERCEAIEVEADGARLQQVLWNVLRNAAKFTPEGGKIFVSSRVRDGEWAEVRVRDTGMGIGPEVLPKIFEAFEQGDEKVTRRFGGLGLGLAISKSLVELHGGLLEAESPGVGQGATFTLRLKRISGQGRMRAAENQKGEKEGQKLWVLVVEDHVDTARVMARLLQSFGHRVSTTGTVGEALQLIGQERFDVLVSDIGLPDGTGYELMRQVKERYSIKGIAMSGYGMEEDVRKSREAGFADHIIKPANPALLERTIRSVCREG